VSQQKRDLESWKQNSPKKVQRAVERRAMLGSAEEKRLPASPVDGQQRKNSNQAPNSLTNEEGVRSWKRISSP